MELSEITKNIQDVQVKMLARIGERDDQIKACGAANEKTAGEIKQLGAQLIELQGEARQKHEEFLKSVRDQGVRIDEVEKRLGRAAMFGNAGIAAGAKTLAEQFVESELYKNYVSNAGSRTVRGTGTFQLKNFFSRNPAEALKATFTATSSVDGDLVPPTRIEPVAPALRQLRIRDLMPVRPLATESITYLEETAFASEAGEVAVSSITRSSQTATVTTSAAHGLLDGDLVRIGGASQTEYNIDAYVTVTSATTFTYTVAGSPASPATGSPTWLKLAGYGAADAVAEGGLKPEALLELIERTVSAQVIAHYIKITRQVSEDAPQVMAYIEDRMLFGLAYKEEQQFLYGSGSGNNLQGIMTHPRAQLYAWSDGEVGDTKIDAIRRAMTVAQVREFVPTGVVLNPMDWEDVELAKGDDGHYLWMALPGGTGGPRIFQLPVVVTNAMAEEDFLVGAFGSGGATIWDREQANVQIATENEDDFIRNKRTLLAEERLALTISRPDSFVVGAFDAAPSE